MTRLTLAVCAITLVAVASGHAQTARRPLVLDDHSTIVAVGDPQRSPDGLQLTSSPDGESSPRWSPDGKYLAFVASRGTEEKKKKGGQIWLLNRSGGEAQQVSDFKGGVSDIQWSPDSTRIAFVARDQDPDDEPEKKDGWTRKTQPPIVIDRYHFKEDREGYLKHLYSHIAVFDLATKSASVITSGMTDDRIPSWSPDGKQIAFLSKRGAADPDRTSNEDLWTIEAKADAVPKQITKTPLGDGGRPAWSPDGGRIAVLLGADDQNTAYGMNKLTVVPSNPPASAGPAVNPPIYMATLDRAVSNIAWSPDGRNIAFLLQDDRTSHVATVPAEKPNGTAQRKSTGRRAIRALSQGKDGNFAVIATSPAEPAEAYALEGSSLRKLTKHNEKLLRELQLATTEDFQSKSKDGADVHGLIVKPAGFKAGTKYPTLLIIHGGPNAQDEHAFSFDREFLAANGYVVLAINYRGSAGRGHAWQKAIRADWGNLEVVDLLGAVDEAVKQGIADPTRLGIGGWSYGGISTNYTIASDRRFKAAVSGAGSSLQFTMYGMD